MEYEIAKWLHILSSTVLFGTGLGSAYYMFFASLTRDPRTICNVVRLVDSPNERVLVIYGAGHLGWLQHDFASDRTLRLRKLAELAK